jgi:hypothetical protein
MSPACHKTCHCWLPVLRTYLSLLGSLVVCFYLNTLPLMLYRSRGMVWYSANDFQPLVTSQVHEMELVRRKIYELEQAQIQIKAKYATAI